MTGDLSLHSTILESMDVTVTFRGLIWHPCPDAGVFESASGGVAALNHRLPAGMPPASL
jgi:hypothetical protein